MKAIFITLVLSFLLTRVLYSQPSNYCKKQLAEYYNLNDSLLTIWRNDKYGCFKKRVLLTDSLILKNSMLIGMPRKVFHFLFGEPENTTADGEFVYYAFAKCDSNFKGLPDSWGSELYVTFIDEKVHSFSIVQVD